LIFSRPQFTADISCSFDRGIAFLDFCQDLEVGGEGEAAAVAGGRGLMILPPKMLAASPSAPVR
jgi:hypothetical protein